MEESCEGQVEEEQQETCKAQAQHRQVTSARDNKFIDVILVGDYAFFSSLLMWADGLIDWFGEERELKSNRLSVWIKLVIGMRFFLTNQSCMVLLTYCWCGISVFGVSWCWYDLFGSVSWLVLLDWLRLEKFVSPVKSSPLIQSHTRTSVDTSTIGPVLEGLGPWGFHGWRIRFHNF